MKLSHKTLAQCILDQEAEHGGSGQLSDILLDMSVIGKIMSEHLNRAGLADIFGASGGQNLSGDSVQKLDILANDLCKWYLRDSEHLAALASEEEDDIVQLNPDSPYVIAFDPLDGSSNIEYNVPVGTIFSIHRKLSSGPAAMEDFLQAGNTQVAAGYILYGSSTILVYTTGHGVNGFTLDQRIGEWLLSHPQIQIPADCSVYSTNEAYVPQWEAAAATFLDNLKRQDGISARHIGSLVADVHRNMLRGGIHLRPYDDAVTQGVKLRMNFELKPLAMIIDQAGGYATTGRRNILDMVPESLHEKQPFIAGNADLAHTYEIFYSNRADSTTAKQ